MNTLTRNGWRYACLITILTLFTPLFSPSDAGGTEMPEVASSVIAPPEVPTLLTPLNGADSVPETVLLRWSDVDGAERYNVQVATDESFSDIVWMTNVPASPVTFGTPTPNSTYFWRVQASNVDGMSSFSNAWVFDTGNVAEDECAVVSPDLLTPLNNSFGNPDSVLLRWEPVEGAERYNVQVAMTNEFDDVIFDTNVPDSPVWFVAPLADTTYFWHVQSVGPDQLCDYGETWRFSTGTRAPREVDAPELLTPLKGATDVPNREILRFERLGDAFRYNVQVAMDKAFGAIIFTKNVPQSPVPFTAPDPGTTYFWRVQTVDDEGNMSKYSAPYWFTTALASEAASTSASLAKAPADFALRDNFPDPFNPSTNITVDIPETTNLRVAVYDMLGKEVMEVTSGSVEAGTHMYTIDASSLPSGTYLYRIETPEFADTKRMVVLK